MSASANLILGAPGVYTLPPEPIRRLTGVRLDACAFVGVAPRGPCRIPWSDNSAEFPDDWRMCDPARRRQRSVAVYVESFDQYRRLFGGFEGPGLLPYAVAAFFEQGGRRAAIVRIVHHYNGPADGAGAAQGFLAGAKGKPLLRARDEGEWGNRLAAAIGWQTRPLPAQALSQQSLALEPSHAICAGTLLRLRLADGALECRFVAQSETQGAPDSARLRLQVWLDHPASGAIAAVELVEGVVEISDGTGSRERFEGLGLDVAHPRWLATVLCRESRLVWPDISWAGQRVEPVDGLLLRAAPPAGQFTGGADRYADITHADFFDPAWSPGADAPCSGVHCLDTLADLAQIVVPDLYHPELPPAQSDVGERRFAGAEFAPCVISGEDFAPEKNLSDLPQLTLTPSDPVQLETIVGLQRALAEFAEIQRECIVLLDVPPGLQPRQLAEWRSRFDSSYCAAYHPWLSVTRAEGPPGGLLQLPPSAVAAGIIAARELAFGIAHGPANAIARQVVQARQLLSAEEQAQLHLLGINLFVQEPGGVRLAAARTLSSDPTLRQLSVRRLLLMLRRTLRRETAWAVFEPHTPALRRELTRMIANLLRRLYRLGAFTGSLEEHAFFVRCDETLNPPHRVESGQLLAEIGVAPAEPLEYIVLRFFRGGDGTLTLEE